MTYSFTTHLRRACKCESVASYATTAAAFAADTWFGFWGSIRKRELWGWVAAAVGQHRYVGGRAGCRHSPSAPVYSLCECGLVCGHRDMCALRCLSGTWSPRLPVPGLCELN